MPARKPKPPKKPMTRKERRAYVNRLVQRIVDSVTQPRVAIP